MIIWCTFLDRHTVKFLSRTIVFHKKSKKKFLKTAFGEFHRFPFKNHQRQEQPRPADSCKGRAIVAITLRGISLKIWLNPNQNFDIRHSGIKGVLPGAPVYTLFDQFNCMKLYTVRDKAKSKNTKSYLPLYLNSFEIFLAFTIKQLDVEILDQNRKTNGCRQGIALNYNSIWLQVISWFLKRRNRKRFFKLILRRGRIRRENCYLP